MQKFYADRETSGPEFDDKLIRLVRVNPAIYDVNHPHYRRNPVRIAIWDRIATELGASSKFLQTKWKNIRYNYLQEIKCLETGSYNANIRKRRFTEDLSFLQNTAQSYNVKKGSQKTSYNSSDNESTASFMCAETHGENGGDAFEIIEIDQSDDEDTQYKADGRDFTNSIDNNDTTEKEQELTISSELANQTSTEIIIACEPHPHPDITIDHKFESEKSLNTTDSFYQRRKSLSMSCSRSSSPLLTPLVTLSNGHRLESNELCSEVTIEPIIKSANVSNNRLSASNKNRNNNSNSVHHTRNLVSSTYNQDTIGDPIELYCLSLVDAFRNMPRSERERVKYEFAKILKDAKYKDQS